MNKDAQIRYQQDINMLNKSKQDESHGDMMYRLAMKGGFFEGLVLASVDMRSLITNQRMVREIAESSGGSSE